MTAFEFRCDACGPFLTIPLEDVRKRRASPPSFKCPTCGAPVSLDVIYDNERLPRAAAARRTLMNPAHSSSG